MTTELFTTTTKQSFIKLTGENWDIYKFQTLNYFYEVEGDDIITGKEKQPEEMILEGEMGSSSASQSPSSSSSLSSSAGLSSRKAIAIGTPEKVEERKKEINRRQGNAISYIKYRVTSTKSFFFKKENTNKKCSYY